MSDTAIVLQIVRRADDRKSPLDGKFVVEYDPRRNGNAPHGLTEFGHLVVTDNPAEAKVFPGKIAALIYYQQDTGVPGGRTRGNQPLGGYHVLSAPLTDYIIPDVAPRPS